MRVLITGCSGFLGNNIAKRLIRKGYQVRGMSRSEMPGIPTYSADIRDLKAVYNCLDEFMPTVVLHLAGIANATAKDIGKIYTTNVEGTENLLESISQLNLNSRFVLFSSAAVYGNQSLMKIPECTPLCPCSHYGMSKVCAEYVANRYREYIDVCTIRPFNIIGLGQAKNFLVPKLATAFSRKETVLELGALDSERDFVPLSLLYELIDRLFVEKDWPEVLNLCTGVGTSVNQLMKIFSEISGHKPLIKTNPKFLRGFEINRLVGDPSRLESFLNRKVAVDLKSEIRKICEG